MKNRMNRARGDVVIGFEKQSHCPIRSDREIVVDEGGLHVFIKGKRRAIVYCSLNSQKGEYVLDDLISHKV